MKNEPAGSLTGDAVAELQPESRGVGPLVVVALALWFGLVLFLGAQGAFNGKPGSPPLPIFLGIALPLLVFLTAYFNWSAFRDFILNADLRLVTAMQGWRWAGLHFLYLYALGMLPGLFAIPAGLGDMAIGFTAPWIVLRLVRNPSFAASRRYVIWNSLGLLDFVIATTTAVLCTGLFPALNSLIGNVTTRSMGQLPLVLTPTYLVPFFRMLHLTALLQVRHLAWGGKSGPVFSG